MHATTAIHCTPLGDMHSVWTANGLYSLNWEQPVDWEQPGLESAAADDLTTQRIEQLNVAIDHFFESGRESFRHITIDDNGWPPFTTRIYQQCRSIDPGTTWTYKKLASAAGNEKASRAAGAAMSRNRILLVIPCHRVVAGGGDLRGFSAPGGLDTKRKLLELEQRQPLLDIALST